MRNCAQLGKSNNAILQVPAKGKFKVGWEEGWMDGRAWSWVRVGF